jgi:phosphopantothenoylcysteine decarboxylase/phosphopantothenate--cysteine ligase
MSKIVTAGVLVQSDSVKLVSSTMSRGNLLFLLSGSIACYKACTVISRLAQAGVTVQTVATPAALRFVGAATLEGLSGRPVFTDVFESGRALDHIELARAADLALVCPATANTINRLAGGMADDPIGALFLAWEMKTKPWWVAPAMNGYMWDHPATTRSLGQLRNWGVRVLDPADGAHACGEIGPGRLVEPEQIAAEVLTALSKK